MFVIYVDSFPETNPSMSHSHKWVNWVMYDSSSYRSMAPTILHKEEKYIDIIIVTVVYEPDTVYHINEMFQCAD